MSDFYGARDAAAAAAADEQLPVETPPMHQQPEQQQQQQDMVAEASPDDAETRLARARACAEQVVGIIYSGVRERELGQTGGTMVAAHCLEY